jgi:endonuclease YncB( thermonuclease family)
MSATAACHSNNDIEFVEGRAKVIDGDTIRVGTTRIRLHGIDAPEKRQSCFGETTKIACGELSSENLERQIRGAVVKCVSLGLDRYGRTIGRCYSNALDLNQYQVSSGWAVAYLRYAEDYVEHEKGAKESGKGIWSYRFVMPWDWRKGKRLSESPASSQDGKCIIKGNINSKGQKIFHTIDGRYYEATRISEEKGERWFCTELEAIKAGWRASSR